jgi:hypothetical protein
VTLWTDWAYAALTFNIYLTPYGTQSINLYDVFQRGAIAPDRAAEYAALPASDPSHCAQLPTQLPAAVLHDLRQIFTLGVTGMQIGRECNGHVGGVHADAIGYATVDVVDTCTNNFPGPAYFDSDILFDNVLIGDYENVNPNGTTGNFATGNPMVHLRAVPEGGPAGSRPGTNLPRTFYGRYTATMPLTVDRRQPLPSMFAARWTEGGRGGFQTRYQIWREALTGPSSTACAVAANSTLPYPFGSIVRFDEHENETTTASNCYILCPPYLPPFPAASSMATTSSLFPGGTVSGDLSGWMYLNFSDVTRRGDQAWVTVSMQAEGRYAVEFDAAALGNGCSPAVAADGTIGPVGGTPVCPAGAIGCTPGTPPYIGTNLNPPPP